ncbi:MAG: polysaccharide deacetylase [Bacillota bacterium]
MSGIWSDGVRCAVALTFDLDAETLWLTRNEASVDDPVLMSQGVYGPRVGAPRLLSMLRTADVRATFFIPGWVIERYPEICRQVVEEGHEIAYHGYMHEKAASPEAEAENIARCQALMRDLLGVTPVGYRAPEFGLTEGTLDVVAEAGLTYSSNFMDSDHPYLHRLAGGRSLVELPVHWIFDDSSHFFFTNQHPPRRPIARPGAVLEIWKSEFDGIYDEGGIMTLVMHPQITGRVSRVRMVAELIAHMKSRPGTLVGPACELAEAARAGLCAGDGAGS